MIKKYLNLLTQAIDSFKHLGRGNSWIDYFHTVGFEFLLLLITVISIAGIFIILFGPYKGTIKIKRYFMGKLNLPCEHLKNTPSIFNQLTKSWEVFIIQLTVLCMTRFLRKIMMLKIISKKLILTAQ